jgi:hypothetical protein
VGPYRLERPALVYSASKTYTALAIGFLADEGRLGLDDSAGLHVGEENPHGITVRHLLTMNTGHSAEQIERIGTDPLVLLREEPAFAPGTHFAYNSRPRTRCPRSSPPSPASRSPRTCARGCSIRSASASGGCSPTAASSTVPPAST